MGQYCAPMWGGGAQADGESPYRLIVDPNTDSASVTHTCAECHALINSPENAVEVGGEHFHRSCFLCAKCKKMILGKVVHLDRQRYCEECGKTQSTSKNPACKKCSKPVVGEKIDALGDTYHPPCFECAACHKQLTNFVPYNNKPHCSECARKTQARASLNLGKGPGAGVPNAPGKTPGKTPVPKLRPKSERP